MMTDILINMSVPSVDGTPIAAVGILTFTPTARHVDGMSVILPKGFPVQLINGTATVTLEPTTPAWVWKIDEGIVTGSTRYVEVDASTTPVRYQDLRIIDPTTMQPSGPPPIDVWIAALDTATTTATITATTQAELAAASAAQAVITAHAMTGELATATAGATTTATTAATTATTQAVEATAASSAAASAASAAASSATDAAASAATVATAYPPIAPALIAPGRKWGFLGDSITNGSNADNFIYSFGPQAVSTAGGLVARTDSYSNGIPGNTSGAMLARISTFLGYGAQAIVLLAGANDAGQAVPLATYASNISAIVAKAKSAGGPVVLCLVPPRGSSAPAPMHAALAGYNLWLRLNGPTLGCEIADTYTALVDTTTGYLRADVDSGDGTHPNTLGHQFMAREVGAAMVRASARHTTASLLTSILPIGNLLPDPLNARATPTADGWLQNVTWDGVNYTFVSDTSGVLEAGRWVQKDADGTSGAINTRQWMSPTITSGFAPGDTVAMVGQVQIDDVSGDWVATHAAHTGRFVASIVDQNTAGIGISAEASTGTPDGHGSYNLGPLFTVGTVRAGVTGLSCWYDIQVPAGSHYRMRLGGLGLLNLTALGADAPGVLWSSSPILY